MGGFKEADYTKKIDLSLWKRLLKYAAAYKKQMLILIIVMIGVGGIDAVFPMMTKYAVDNYIIPAKLNGIWRFAAIYGFLVAAQAVNVYILISLAGFLEMGIGYDIRKKGFEKLQELSLSYYDRTPVGWIMARMTSDISRLGDTIAWGIVDMMGGAVMMAAIIAALFIMNWKLAFITLTVIPPLALLSVYFQNKILELQRIVRKTNSRITGAFNEGIMGAKTTKTLVREEKNLDEFQDITGMMYKSSVRVAVVSSIYLPLVMTLGSIGTALALWLGGNKVISGTLTYGTLVAFISYTTQFFEPVRDVARVLTEFQSAQASAERVLSMVETEPDIKDSDRIVKEYGDLFSPKTENWPDISGAISFRNVSFSYKDGEEVLENFSLDVRSGEKIALVGETGSGKSTIVNLVCRFYEPTEGEILIDGVDYRERSQLWLQSNLGYVLQTPHLFGGTVRDNIRYGRLGASDEEIINASKLVNADGFIMKLEHGYDTEVGEGGNRLSTGEKQLISFARAILADPKILVLDEATSSIDTETEMIIQHAIEKVLEGRTSFIIAHRLSTIRNADRILVIKDGRVIEEGNHFQLLRKRGYYYKLYTNQFKEEQGIKAINQ